MALGCAKIQSDFKKDYVIKQLQNKYGIYTNKDGRTLHHLSYRELVFLLARNRAMHQ